MRELQIILPYYEKRESDMCALVTLAMKYELEYDAYNTPCMTVIDVSCDTTILESTGNTYVSISGNEESIEKFLKELEKWTGKRVS